MYRRLHLNTSTDSRFTFAVRVLLFLFWIDFPPVVVPLLCQYSVCLTSHEVSTKLYTLFGREARDRFGWATKLHRIDVSQSFLFGLFPSSLSFNLLRRQFAATHLINTRCTVSKGCSMLKRFSIHCFAQTSRFFTSLDSHPSCLFRLAIADLIRRRIDYSPRRFHRLKSCNSLFSRRFPFFPSSNTSRPSYPVQVTSRWLTRPWKASQPGYDSPFAFQLVPIFPRFLISQLFPSITHNWVQPIRVTALL